MRVVDIAQRTPEWHEWRKGGVSATSLSIILGKNPQKSRRQLWLELKGYATPPDLSVIPQVRKGEKLEPLSLQAFEAKYGQLALPVCGEHEEHPWMRASFDGLLAGNQPVEIKNLAESNHLDVLEKEKDSAAYQLYQWQVKHQLVVSGAKLGWLWFWSPKHTPVCLTVELSAEEEKYILDVCRTFWQSILDDDIPDPDPEVDPLPIPSLTAESQQTWMDISEQRKGLEREIKKHEAALKELRQAAKEHEDVLRSLMGDFRYADHNGVRITQYDIKGRVDWEAIARREISAAVLENELIAKFSNEPTKGCRVTVNPDFDQATQPAIPLHLYRRKAAREKSKQGTEPAQLRNAFWF